MIYDPIQKALYADDGRFIKRIHCPLADVPAHLRQFVRTHQDQFCFECKKTVHNINHKTDVDVIALVEAEPDACFFATAQANHIVFLQPPSHIDNPKQLPVISTARTLEAMNMLQQAGFRLVIKETGIKNRFGERQYQVFEHVTTKRLLWNGDLRTACEPGDDWRLVKDWFWARSDRPFPLAAYVVPQDLKPNTHVYLEDVIEDIHRIVHNQGNGGRLHATEAIWDGKDFVFKRKFQPYMLG